ncbi:MAG: TetR/AcrR family transcriptional regulator C-terminal domain-containing protein [Eubacteriales bacterium]
MKHEVTSLNTKRALAESLKKIMKKKPFSKITVSEIIADCGVNRKTFYYHFEDIYALLKWVFDVEAIEIVKHFDLMTDYRDAILFVMDYVDKNDYIINCAYDAIGRDEMKRFLSADFRAIMRSVIDGAEKECQVKLSPEYKDFLCTFCVEALTSVLIDVIKKRGEYDRERMVKYISDTIKFSLVGIMDSVKES